MPHDRVQLDQVEIVAEQVGHHLGEGEQARAGVEAERAGGGPPVVPAELAADLLATLEHGHPVAGRREAHRGRQAADARADDDDLHAGSSIRRPFHASLPCRRRRKEMATSQANSTIDTGWARACGNARAPVARAVTIRLTTPSA